MLTHFVGLGLPILLWVCLSLRWKGLGGPFPVPAAAGHPTACWKLQAFIIWNRRGICMLRKAGEGWAIQGESPTPTPPAVLKIVA